MKKKIVDNINSCLKKSLIKPPIYDANRFANISECIDYMSTSLSNWNAHSWLTIDYNIDPDIVYCKTSSDHQYLLFTSSPKKFIDYTDNVANLLKEENRNFVISTYSDSIIQVLMDLYPFMPANTRIKFRMVDNIHVTTELVKNKFSIIFKNNIYSETIPELPKVDFESLVLYLVPSMAWIAHFFADDDRVKVYSNFKSTTFIPLPTRTVSGKRIMLQAKVAKKEKYINYGDLPKIYWPSM